MYIMASGLHMVTKIKSSSSPKMIKNNNKRTCGKEKK